MVLATVTVYAFATAPASIDHVARVPTVPDGVDEWLAASERAISARTTIIDGTEKRVRWFENRRNSKTPYSIVYLHGFSATRQEVAPVAEIVADALGANLFETRLSGHGLSVRPLTDVRAESWLDDAAEALRIGALIGDDIVLIGTSTGGTLAIAMVDHESFDAVVSVVLISPNFAPVDSAAELLTWPGGPILARLLVGETRSWTAANDRQEEFWSTTYPMSAAIEMMRLVNLARSKLPASLDQSLLTFYSPNDQVVDPVVTAASLRKIDSARAEVVQIEESGDPSNHVLAGDILAPQNNRLIAEHIVQFLGASEL